MKTKKIQKKMTLKKQTIAALDVDEMRRQHGGTDTNPLLCSADTFCVTDCRPRSACNGYTCALSC
jgi:hypothetical protein